jgi:hypothetical protein
VRDGLARLDKPRRLRQIAVPFVRGDVDSEDGLALQDTVQVLRYLYLGQPQAIPCPHAADADDSGEIDLADAVFIVNRLYRGGPSAGRPTSGDRSRQGRERGDRGLGALQS